MEAMALITCKDCKKEYSSDSNRCVHCGAKKPSKIVKYGGRFLVGIFALSFFSTLTHSNSAPQASQASAPTATSSSASIQATNPIVDQKVVAAALSKMKKKYDKFEKITWYTDKSTPENNNVNSFNIYIGKNDGDALPYLRLKVQYAGGDWLFIKGYSLMVDGKIYDYPSINFERDHYTTVWEWADVAVGNGGTGILRTIADSKETTIRYAGQKYTHDRAITKKEKESIKNVLDAYQALGGK
jgi:hypothetical protein